MKTIKTVVTAACMTAALSNFASAGEAAKAPVITNYDKRLLDTAPESVIENESYMKVIEPKGAKAKGLRVFESTDGKLSSDFAEYEKVTLKLKDWPIDEYMYIIEGELKISDEQGNTKIYGPGDSFMMPKGFSGTWQVLSKLKKITVNYER
ncbi:cupin domain-containing protein [Pseudomonas sp. BGr12]|uniref:cupin domain-containing protein n=1 Tax=Pseudomonas sp. BGr12 TaxID=2936269 RepID=UPI00255A2C9E|nr:cupin domain-containing protein [Pseudomonas sp. BJa5]MDL2428462.1 cupin domain-containing protein [Pseudomonas sp. BJa5]